MNLKQLIGTKIIFGPAFPLFLRLADAFQYWITVIHNKTFNGEINGEYWLRDQFLDGKVYVDVGFNRGEWAKYISQKNHSAKIFAFDPCMDVVKEFESERERYKNIELFQMALSDEEGSLDFYDYGSLNGCNSLAERDIDFGESVKPNIYKVAVATLDKWALEKNVEHIDFLKVDAEGYDLNVLEGSSQLLQKQMIDAVLFEYATGWLCSRRTLKEAVKFFEQKPYHLFKLFNGFLLPFDYKSTFEGSMFSIFVAISDNALKRHSIGSKIRYLNF